MGSMMKEKIVEKPLLWIFKDSKEMLKQSVIYYRYYDKCKMVVTRLERE